MLTFIWISYSLALLNLWNYLAFLGKEISLIHAHWLAVMCFPCTTCIHCHRHLEECGVFLWVAFSFLLSEGLWFWASWIILYHISPETLLTWSRVSTESRRGMRRGTGLVRNFYRAIFPINNKFFINNKKETNFNIYSLLLHSHKQPEVSGIIHTCGGMCACICIFTLICG